MSADGKIAAIFDIDNVTIRIDDPLAFRVRKRVNYEQWVEMRVDDGKWQRISKSIYWYIRLASVRSSLGGNWFMDTTFNDDNIIDWSFDEDEGSTSLNWKP